MSEKMWKICASIWTVQIRSVQCWLFINMHYMLTVGLVDANAASMGGDRVRDIHDDPLIDCSYWGQAPSPTFTYIVRLIDISNQLYESNNANTCIPNGFIETFSFLATQCDLFMNIDGSMICALKCNFMNVTRITITNQMDWKWLI